MRIVRRCDNWGLGLVLALVASACGGKESPRPSPDSREAERAIEPEVATAEPGGAQPGQAVPGFASGYQPVTHLHGWYRGTLELESKGGALLRVPVRAHAGATAGEEDWDLYFQDASFTIASNGVLAWKGGSTAFIRRDSDSHVLRAAAISVEEGVFDVPGRRLFRHARTGDLKGELWLRVPSPGADLDPLRVRFWLSPAHDLGACVPSSCGEGELCDVSGFCVPSPHRAADWGMDTELLAINRAITAWLAGPVVVESGSLPAVWCASDELEFRGTFAPVALGAPMHSVMDHSGDLFCVDPASARVGARGPVPLANRADLQLRAMVAAIPPAALARLCAAELARVPPAGFGARAGHDVEDFSAYRDGFLNFVPECISVGHVAAVLQKAQHDLYEVESDRPVQARRMLQRVLQQWLHVHTFMIEQGLQAERAGWHAQSPSLRVPALVDRAEQGLTLLLQILGSNAIENVLDVRQPDYRMSMRFGVCSDVQPCADPALRCQSLQEACGDAGAPGCTRACVLRAETRPEHTQALGLAPALYDLLGIEVEALATWLSDPGIAEPGARQRALRAVGDAVRVSLLVETLAAKMKAAALRCPEGPDGPALTCATPAWLPAFEKGRARFLRGRAALLARAHELTGEAAPAAPDRAGPGEALSAAALTDGEGPGGRHSLR